jgi:hypothetical protein
MTTRNESSPEKKRMTLTEAAAYLGTSQAKLSRLVASGQLAYSVDPLDLRRKLVEVSDLKRLKEKSLLAQGED